MPSLFRDVSLIVLLVLGTLGLSQVPSFVAAYEQRLGGALQEAERQLGEFRAVAARQGIDVEALAGRLRGSEDAAVSNLGEVVERTQTRVRSLQGQAEALARAGHFVRPFVLAWHYDSDLLEAAWRRFQPGLTLDPGFAAAGALLAWLANAAGWSLVRPRRRRPRLRPAKPAGTSKDRL